MIEAGIGFRTPLEEVSRAAPRWLGPALSVGGRAAGGAIAVYLAATVSYDRTQVVSMIIAILAVASLASVLLPGMAGDAAAALTAGVLFFGGAMLWSEDAAKAMPVAGFATLAGTLMAGSLTERSPLPVLAAFFAGFGVIVGMLVLVALTVEG